jgi:hypothetical protein
MKGKKLTVDTGNTSINNWEAKFDEEVKELDDGIGAMHHDFGYKMRKGDEIFTVPDWGNIKQFISQLLEKQVGKIVEEIEGFRVTSFKTNGQEGQTEREIKYQINKTIDGILDKLNQTEESE